MRPLTTTIRPYAWGSRTALAALRGQHGPTAEPEAEMWFGAHPGAPSRLPGGVSLATAFVEDPTLLGTAAAPFGRRLPYLMKLLAAAEPLSLQAHPDPDRARAGFAAGNPNYTDPYAKPELLVALGEFEGLCGFRAPDEAAEAIATLGVPALAPVVEVLRTGSVEQRLRGAVELLLRWPAGDRSVVEQVVKAAAGVPSRAHADAHAVVVELGRRYPGDLGVIVTLLLNHVVLRPDAAVFMPAGNLHAYLRGVGLEIMAASDNVLRGGLTPKRIDVDELLRVLRYEVLPDPIVPARRLAPGLWTWPAPVAEFALHKASVDTEPVTLPGGGPRIVVATAGAGLLRTRPDAASAPGATQGPGATQESGATQGPGAPQESGATPDELAMTAGGSVFVSATDPAVTVHGAGLTVFQASIPAPRP